MEDKLEQLLNMLIQRGWKPFWKSNRWNVTIDKTIKTKSPFFDFDYHNMSVSTRELISKESGLWQFVCENGLIKRPRWEAPDDVRVWRYVETMGTVWNRCFGKRKPEFYIIESALKDESELESFILDNIKVDG